MDDLLSDFLAESLEALEKVDADLVSLEKDPGNNDLISSIFRAVHTIKGTCGFIGLTRLEKIAHAGENVLGKVRDGSFPASPVVISSILECVDVIKTILDGIKNSGSEPTGDDSALATRLNHMAENGPDAGAQASSPVSDAASESFENGVSTEPSSDSMDATPTDEKPSSKKKTAKSKKTASDQTDESVNILDNNDSELSESSKAEAAKEDVSDQPVAASENGVDSAPVGEKPTVVPQETVVAAPPTPPAVDASKAPPSSPETEKKGPPEGVAVQTIRINVALIENLMTMVSELVLTRNQLLQIVRQTNNNLLSVPLQRLNYVTSELQEGVMKTRMQPIASAWANVPRLIRDLAHELNKKIDIKMMGAETEVDRQVIEMIKDPLTHMIRNSADHGIEKPDERVAAGKIETATVTLNAFHAGGHIVIEVGDDGRGLPADKIKAKAIANGLITEEAAANLSATQIHQFIFKAGLSTAEKITNVSGRGVGMDVVKSNIEKIGGTIDVKSTPGQGTTFVIKIPLTLAIVSALIVESCDCRFAIPQLSVIELVKAAQNSTHTLEFINNLPFLRLRDKLLPLISLAQLFNYKKPKMNDASLSSNGEECLIVDQKDYIVVLQVGQETFGVIVDQIFDTQEIVVKPVSPLLRDIPFFSGNTILGDGSVIMIIDPNGIADHVRNGSIMESAQEQIILDDEQKTKSSETESYLLVKAGEGGPKAVPLAVVARLENIDIKDIEISNGQPMIQYRNHLMPLVAVDGSDGFENATGYKPTLVITRGEHVAGLVVDEILDIVEDSTHFEIKSNTLGSLGSCIINGHATDVVDVDYYVSQRLPGWFDADEPRYQERA